MRPASSVALGVELTQDLLLVLSKPITQDNSSGQQLAKPNLLVFERAQLFVYLLYGVHCIAGGCLSEYFCNNYLLITVHITTETSFITQNVKYTF